MSTINNGVDVKEWELIVLKSRSNLWLITTESSKLLCVKFKSKFYIKDCVNMLPVKESILFKEKL